MARKNVKGSELMNLDLTDEQFDVVCFIAFEARTSEIYPFDTTYRDVTLDMVNHIVEECEGLTDDTDTVYAACEAVLGINSFINQR